MKDAPLFLSLRHSDMTPVLDQARVARILGLEELTSSWGQTDSSVAEDTQMGVAHQVQPGFNWTIRCRRLVAC